MLVKYAKTHIEKAFSYQDFNSFVKVSGKDVQSKLLSKIASIPLLKAHPENYIYIRNRSISAMETYGANQNWDAFPSKELQTKYSTFLNCPIDVDHVNEQPERDVIGIVLDSTYIDKMVYRAGLPYLLKFPTCSPKEAIEQGLLKESDRIVGDYVENLLVIDKKLANNKIAGLSDGILKREIVDTSMGCSVQKSECSVCHNMATQPDEFCEHILYGKGQQFNGKSGKLVVAYEINHGIEFFEDSIILSEAFAKKAGVSAGAGGEGADSRAEILEVYSKLKKEPSITDFVKKSYFFLQPAENFYVTIGEEPSKVKEGREKYEKEMEERLKEKTKELHLDDDKKISYYNLYEIGYKNLNKKGKFEEFQDTVTSQVLGTDWYDVKPNGLSSSAKLKLRSFYSDFLKKALKEDLISIIRAILKDQPNITYSGIQERVQKLNYRQKEIDEILGFEYHFGKVSENIKEELKKKSAHGESEMGNLIDRYENSVMNYEDKNTDQIGDPMNDDNKYHKDIPLNVTCDLIEDNVENHKDDKEMEKLAPEDKISEIQGILKVSEQEDRVKDDKQIHQGTGMESVNPDILNKNELDIKTHKNKDVANYADLKQNQEKEYQTDDRGMVQKISGIQNILGQDENIQVGDHVKFKVDPNNQFQGDQNDPRSNPLMVVKEDLGNNTVLVGSSFLPQDAQYSKDQLQKVSKVNPAADELLEERIEENKNFAFENAEKLLKDKSEFSEGNVDELKLEDKIKETKAILKISYENFKPGDKVIGVDSDQTGTILREIDEDDPWFKKFIKWYKRSYGIDFFEEGRQGPQGTFWVVQLDDSGFAGLDDKQIYADNQIMLNKSVVAKKTTALSSEDKEQLNELDTDEPDLSDLNISEDEEKEINKTKDVAPVEDADKYRTYQGSNQMPVEPISEETTLGQLNELWDSSSFDSDIPITDLIETYGPDYKVELKFIKPDYGTLVDPQGNIKSENSQKEIEFWNYPNSKYDYYDKPVTDKKVAGKIVKILPNKIALVDWGKNSITEVPLNSLVIKGNITDNIPAGTPVEIKNKDTNAPVETGNIQEEGTIVGPDGKEKKTVKTQDGKEYAVDDFNVNTISSIKLENSDLGIADLNIKKQSETSAEVNNTFDFEDPSPTPGLNIADVQLEQRNDEHPLNLEDVSASILFDTEEPIEKNAALADTNLNEDLFEINNTDSNVIKNVKSNLNKKHNPNAGNTPVKKTASKTPIDLMEDPEFWGK